MGIPSFFRWLSNKYPEIVSECYEEKCTKLPNGRVLQTDTSLPNPNKVEFDNLYLDMNGIIHLCTHPKEKSAPRNEDGMMIAIFEYVDNIFNIVRPRKLLYIAIDGVAPRAKMNQQRSRRFRATKEADEKLEEMARIKEDLKSKGVYVSPQEEEKIVHFDSNCITPGTPFMLRLSKCLQYFVQQRLHNDPGWKDIIVILSDANVPGEAEHKIMDYIRRQRAQPNHDPNTKHVLWGSDADLIMLGLATHEYHFTIIREKFTPFKPSPCDICNRPGHEMKDCQGGKSESTGKKKIDEIIEERKFIFVRLSVLREYLERELAMPNLPFPYDLERAIDDWIFMCFFVGNDYLPALPSLPDQIEKTLKRLVKLMKDVVQKTGGWLTDSGFLALERVQLVFDQLGKEENEIFKQHQQNEIRSSTNRSSFEGVSQQLPRGESAPRPVGREAANRSIEIDQNEAVQKRQHDSVRAPVSSVQDKLSRLTGYETRVPNSEIAAVEGGVKRKAENMQEGDAYLWKEGHKKRYYESKFAVGPDDIDFRTKITTEYVRGLCWVLQYYYQGVPSWRWYFPYHYAPFASDFQCINKVDCIFQKDIPLLPMEQLMCVLPPSRSSLPSLVPEVFARLMVDPNSPVIDYYPSNFSIDLNQKRFSWQGVARLPFVDVEEILKAMAPHLARMTEIERLRNIPGDALLYCGRHHPGYTFLRGLLEKKPTKEKQVFDLIPHLFYGMYGHVWKSVVCEAAGGTVESPVMGLEDIYHCHVVCLSYSDPIPEGLNFKYLVHLLPGASPPLPMLKPVDCDPGASRDRHNHFKFELKGANRNQRGKQADQRVLGVADSLHQANSQERNIGSCEEEIVSKRELEGRKRDRERRDQREERERRNRNEDERRERSHGPSNSGRQGRNSNLSGGAWYTPRDNDGDDPYATAHYRGGDGRDYSENRGGQRYAEIIQTEPPSAVNYHRDGHNQRDYHQTGHRALGDYNQPSAVAPSGSSGAMSSASAYIDFSSGMVDSLGGGPQGLNWDQSTSYLPTDNYGGRGSHDRGARRGRNQQRSHPQILHQPYYRGGRERYDHNRSERGNQQQKSADVGQTRPLTAVHYDGYNQREGYHPASHRPLGYYDQEETARAGTPSFQSSSGGARVPPFGTNVSKRWELPDRWLAYSPLGQPIESLPIRACKVPLEEGFFLQRGAAECRFTPQMLIAMVPNLGCVIDLTNTTRYYNSKVFTDLGIQYSKIKCEGHVEPKESQVHGVFKVIDNFLLNPDGKILVMHCTHGLNRTGYFLTRYMVEQLGFTPDNAIAAFNRARGHEMERSLYIEIIKNLDKNK